MASIEFLQDIDIDGNVLLSKAGNAELTLLRTSGAELTLRSQSNLGTLTTTNNFPLHLGTNGGTRMVILTNGNVGVNTTSPSYKFSVSGSIGTTNSGSIYIGGAIGDTVIGRLGNTSGVLNLEGNSARSIRLGSATNGEVVRVDNANLRVGIGTTSPSAKLHIVGADDLFATKGLLIENNSGTDTFFVTNEGIAGFYKHGVTNALHVTGKQTYSGNYSTLVGHQAGGGSGMTGSYQAMFGAYAGDLITGDSTNATIIGGAAGYQANAPTNSVMVGYHSGSTSDGNNNTFVGYYTRNKSGSQNVMIGRQAGDQSYGGQNVYIGSLAGYDVGASGNNSDSNVFIGYEAGRLTQDGVDRNIFLGYRAGYNTVNLGSGNTVIGDRILQSSTEALSNTVVIGAGSYERFRVDSNGNMGIGTTSPSAKLSILGAAQGDEVLRLSTAVDTRGLKVTTFAAGTQGNAGINFDAFHTTDAALSFSTKGTEALYIDGSQNIGIGTTSPNGRLNIKSSAASTYLLNLDYADGTDGGGFYEASSTDLSLYLKNSSGTNTVTITTGGDSYFNGGNVGIGTTSPGAKLDIIDSSIGIRVKKSDLSDVFRVYAQGSGIFMNEGDVHITDDLIVGSNGTPSAKLHIIGSGNTSATTSLLVENSDGTDLLKVFDSGTSQFNGILDVNGSVDIDGSSSGALNVNISSGSYPIRFSNASSTSDVFLGIAGASNDFILYVNSADRLRVKSDGQLQLNNYGSGTFTGTAAYTLAVDSSGNIIETSGGGGSTPTLQEVTTAGNTTTDDVGIQMSNPVSALHIGDGNNTISSVLYSTDIVNVSAQNTAPGFNIISAGSSTYNRGVFKATRSRGTLASPTAAVNGDYVFSLLGVVYDGGAGRATAGVEMLADGTVSSGNAPQRIEFQTGTTTSRSTRMTIKSDGDVGIGTTNPLAKLHLVGETATDTVDALFVENSSGNDLFKITNTGNFYMKHATRTNSIIINNYDTTGTGASCTLIGDLAGVGSNVNGSFLTAVGRNAANNATGGASSVVVGPYAASSCGNLFGTVAIGSNAGRNAGNAYYNVAIGADACNGSSLRYSVVIGASAGRGTGTSLQDRNVYIGYQTAYNSNLNDGNTVIGARLQSSSTEGLSNTVIIGSDNAERLRIDSTGKFKFDSYGSGSFTGTQTVNLEADSSGNIIERLEERGTFSVSTNSTGDGSFSHSLGETPTIVMLTADIVGSATVTINVSSKNSTTINVKSSQRNATVTGYYIISS